MSRPISDAWFHRIKAATRDLVEFCGGVERSGVRAGLSPSQISRCQVSSDATILSIPAALALEAECGQPLITAAMAEINGRHLSEGAANPEKGACLVSSHSELLSDFAKLVTEFAHAAADGKFTPGEIENIERAKASVFESLNGLGQACASAKASASSAPVRLVPRGA